MAGMESLGAIEVNGSMRSRGSVATPPLAAGAEDFRSHLQALTEASGRGGSRLPVGSRGEVHDGALTAGTVAKDPVPADLACEQASVAGSTNTQPGAATFAAGQAASPELTPPPADAARQPKDTPGDVPAPAETARGGVDCACAPSETMPAPSTQADGAGPAAKATVAGPNLGKARTAKGRLQAEQAAAHQPPKHVEDAVACTTQGAPSAPSSTPGESSGQAPPPCVAAPTQANVTARPVVSVSAATNDATSSIAGVRVGAIRSPRTSTGGGSILAKPVSNEVVPAATVQSKVAGDAVPVRMTPEPPLNQGARQHTLFTEPIVHAGLGLATASVAAPAGNTASLSPHPESSASGVLPAHAEDSAAEVGLASKTLLAAPSVLEIGVATGTHGWIRVRAELGKAGDVSTAVLASSASAVESLRRELPALTSYLGQQAAPTVQLAAPRADESASAGLLAGQQGDGERQTRHADTTRNPMERGGSNKAESVSASMPGARVSPSLGGSGVQGGWLSVRV